MAGMMIPREDLRMIQLLELDMLVELDRVCRANNIKYVMTGGTMLGAIRHKGFIPWDDDIDVCMLREEYKKFAAVADQLDPKICFLQDHDIESEYRWGYNKLRRTGTSYVRTNQEHLKQRDGIFIDVFVLDDVAKTAIGAEIQTFICYIARKICYSEIGRVTQKGFWKLWFTLLSKIPLSVPFSLYGIYEKRSKNSTPNRVKFLSRSQKKGMDKYTNGKKRYGRSKHWMLDVQDYEFEGHKFLGPIEWNDYLTWSYGKDYMTPPPEDKRYQNSPCSSYSFGDAKPVYYKDNNN